VAKSEVLRASMMLMNNNHPLTRTLASAATIAALAGAALAPAAHAASAGQTVKVTADHAYVDNKRPGFIITGTVFKGDKFKIDRTALVKKGSAKGLWYHGVATITGDHAKDRNGVVHTFHLKGWVKAAAFA
jgi:hypothetical protein